VGVTTSADAAAYDAHVVPRYAALFGRLALRAVPEGARMQVLDVACASGFPALEVMRRLGEGGRVIAIDADSPLLDVARRRALDEAGRRIFFKTESVEQLSFREEAFDLVVANLALGALEHAQDALLEMHRVLIPAGRLVLTHPLIGTFEEVLDMFREVALKNDAPQIAQRVERLVARYPTRAILEAALVEAGFEGVRIEVEEFAVPFASPAALFADPMVRFVALPEWVWVAGAGDEALPGSPQSVASDPHGDAAAAAVLDQVRRSLEVYFGGGPLTLRVCAGLVTAHT
jgi:ubiquinone/menaquinone biosynthesis C-methylase UbiE